jgi:hypothetical protein
MVIDLVQPDVTPTLTQGEVELEVDRAQLARTWTINTSYGLGSAVVPPDRNGVVYITAQPGTSHSVAHAYSDWADGFTEGPSSPQLRWQEVGTAMFNPGIAGAEWNIYDINRAARECWLLKARKAAQLLDDGDVRFSQIRKNCLEEADKFRPFRRAIELVRC